MAEIKDRVAHIDGQLRGWRDRNEMTHQTCEMTALHLRKIYELVGFAAMTADLERYRTVAPNFSKHWNFAQILKAIARVNPDFLPKPIRRVQSEQEGVDWHMLDRPEAALTMDELIKRHGYLHAFLHSRNPFKVEVNLDEDARRLDTWVREIVSLLSQHRYVVGPNQEGYLVEMNVHGVDVTVFEYTRRG